MGVSLAACGNHPPTTTVGGAPSAGNAVHSQGYYKVGRPYQIEGMWYYPRENWDYDEVGTASWYGEQFHGRYTADGEIFNLNELTAAHRTLPMPVVVRVTNLENGRSIKLRVNDRGPYARGRIIDVSRRAAQMLGFEGQGTTRVRVQIVVPDSMEVASAAGRIGPTPGVSEAVAAIVSAPLAVPVSVLEAMRASGKTSTPAPQPASATLVAQVHPAVAPLPQSVASVKLAATLPPPPPRPEIKVAAAQPVALPPPAPSTAVDARPYVIDDLPASPVPPTQAMAPPPPPPAKIKMAALHANQIFVQAGAFASESNAVHLQSQLQALGSPVNVTAGMTGSGTSIYRVRVGPVVSVGAADALVSRIVSSGVAGARIVVD
jgi:rare lipoprotein A